MDIIIHSPTSIEIDGVNCGAVVDAIANNRALAPAIQRAFVAWHAKETASIAEARTRAEAEGTKAAANFIEAQITKGVESANAERDTAKAEAAALKEQIAQLEAKNQVLATKAATTETMLKDTLLAQLRQELGLPAVVSAPVIDGDVLTIPQV